MIDWPKVVRDLEAENARLKKALAECRSIELQEPEQNCKTHPDAPHGFCRNASLSEDRYVCECEFWEPPQRTEPEQEHCCPECGCHFVGNFPFDYKIKQSPQHQWVGLTKDEVNSWELPDCPTVFEFAQFIEAKLKEKNT